MTSQIISLPFALLILKIVVIFPKIWLIFISIFQFKYFVLCSFVSYSRIFNRVHGKTTYAWHTDDIRVHTNDIRMTYEYIRVTYGWHTSIYEWHTDGIRVHMSDIRMTCEHIRVTYGWHTSDIQMAYEYIRVTYRWHATTYEWHRDDTRLHTSDIQMTYEYMRVTYKLHANDMRVAYEWHANDIRYSKPCKGFGTLRSYFQTYCGKNIVLGGCKWFLANRLFRFPYFLLEYSAV